MPSVLFVCVHNAGRSQMAAGFLRALSGGAVEVRSAGSVPADRVNPVAVEAMAEVGVDLAAEQPEVLTTDAVRASDVVITMGCGDACPIFPGRRYEDWQLDDPAGRGIEAVRPIRDEIERRVRELLASLGVAPVGAPARASGRAQGLTPSDTSCGPAGAAQHDPAVPPPSEASARSLEQTPVAGRSSSTASADARSPASAAATERTCS